MKSINYNLESDRKKIDILDKRILKLLNDRAKLSVNIARIKLKTDAPIFSPHREDELLEKIMTQNDGPFDNKAIQNIFNSILIESKRLQNFVLEMASDDK